MAYYVDYDAIKALCSAKSCIGAKERGETPTLPPDGNFMAAPTKWDTRSPPPKAFESSSLITISVSRECCKCYFLVWRKSHVIIVFIF